MSRTVIRYNEAFKPRIVNELETGILAGISIVLTLPGFLLYKREQEK
jgi:hypothetical protein